MRIIAYALLRSYHKLFNPAKQPLAYQTRHDETFLKWLLPRIQSTSFKKMSCKDARER